MNRDGLPELRINDFVETEVFTYNPSTNQYIMDQAWRKGYGNDELENLFWAELFNGYGNNDDINMAMFPNYSPEEKDYR